MRRLFVPRREVGKAIPVDYFCFLGTVTILVFPKRVLSPGTRSCVLYPDEFSLLNALYFTFTYRFGPRNCPFSLGCLGPHLTPVSSREVEHRELHFARLCLLSPRIFSYVVGRKVMVPPFYLCMYLSVSRSFLAHSVPSLFSWYSRRDRLEFYDQSPSVRLCGYPIVIPLPRSTDLPSS